MILELRNVTKTYYTKNIATTAVNNISLSVHESSFVAIRGASGSGKSTLLSLAGLLDFPDEGEIIFNGKDRFPIKSREPLLEFRRKTAFVFQNFKLLENRTVRENVELPLQYSNSEVSEPDERVANVLENVGLSHRMEHYPSQLSGGQQQRVAIARALIRNPDIIFADEPTGNLDEESTEQVMTLLHDINKQGTAILMVTHDPNIIENLPEVLTMDNGNLMTKEPMLQ